MMSPTESEAIRISQVIGVLAICCARNATTSSKSRVYGAPALAQRPPRSARRSQGTAAFADSTPARSD